MKKCPLSIVSYFLTYVLRYFLLFARISRSPIFRLDHALRDHIRRHMLDLARAARARSRGPIISHLAVVRSLATSSFSFAIVSVI